MPKCPYRVLILGTTESGKSTAAEIIATILNTTYANTSDMLVEDFAEANNLSIAYVLENKQIFRDRLFAFGRAKQLESPLYPQQEQLLKHDVLTGLRNPNEIEAARKYKLYDLIIWINRTGYGPGSTDKLGPADADVVIDNDGTIEELKLKLQQILDQYQAKSKLDVIV